MTYCDHDQYGEVINGQNTYNWVAKYLKEMGRCFIGWTDQQGTHFDILFTYQVPSDGANIQGGLQPIRDLFVSVMRKGAFGFQVMMEYTHENYVDEKIGGPYSLGATSKPLADLINEVKTRLAV